MPLSVSVQDPAGEALPAVIPLQVEIRDANGRLAEGSGYHATEVGAMHLDLLLATNEDPGNWQITVLELASRRSASVSMRVNERAKNPPAP